MRFETIIFTTITFQSNKAKPSKEGKASKVKNKPKEEPTKKPLYIPSLNILTLQEFNDIPKYMKGKLVCTIHYNEY